MSNFATIFTVSALSLLAADAASADPGQGKGKGKAKGASAEHAADVYSGERRQYSRLGDYERGVLRDYYSNGADCPPGLAKKNNGCLPPGIAKKRYQVGRRLSDEVYVTPVPHDLHNRLPILPDEYGYRLIDGDLGVIELATLVVLDALNFY